MIRLRSLLNALFAGPRPYPQAPEPPSPGMARLHLFAGTFESEAHAMAYVYDAPDPIHPQPFTNDLPEATIDITHVEIAFASRITHAARIIAGYKALDLLHQIDPDNTLIIVSEDAFSGLPFVLQDTPKARYLGRWEVQE